MNILEFNLIGERTAEDIYKDNAVVSGYKAKVTDSTEYEETGLTLEEYEAYVYPKGTVEESKRHVHNGDDTHDITYTVELEIDNPISDIDFGKALTDKSFQAQDSMLAGKATEMRSKAGYEAM